MSLRESRLDIGLRVQLWGTNANGRPFIEAACALNISEKGFRLQKVRARLKPGDVVSLVYGGKKAPFRVVWIGEGDTPREHHVGLLLADPQHPLWENEIASSLAQPQDAHAERRQHDRFECFLGALVQVEGEETPRSAQVRDLSLGGCCIHLSDPLKIGSHVVIDLLMNNGTLRVGGTVRDDHGARGVGIEFQDLSGEGMQQLRQFLKWSSRTWHPAKTRRSEPQGSPVT
jgi:PilZ domain